MLFYSSRKRLTFKSLDAALRSALWIKDFDAWRDCTVIFSDIHKGDKRGSDDLRRNEMVLLYALQHYYEEGFRLILNGDIEEGWECRYADIAAAYGETLYFMEKRFNERGSGHYLRTYGNHDEWLKKKKNWHRYLTPLVGETTVYPAVRLGEHILVVHGHQGEEASDVYSYRGRLLTRFLWRYLQRFFGMSVEGITRNEVMKNSRDRLLYEWAEARGMVVVAGHTHRAIFKSRTELQSLRQVRKRILGGKGEFNRRFILPEIERRIKAQEKRLVKENELSQPLYFNGGCSVYRNGITGIEIAEGRIRLVKWQYDDSFYDEKELRRSNFFRINRRIFDSEELENIFEVLKVRSR